MTEPAEAVNAHRGSQHEQRHSDRADCRRGTQRQDGSRKAPALGARRPADDPPSPDDSPGAVAVLLRKLRDAAAAHDGE